VATHHPFVVPVVYLEMKLLEAGNFGGPSAVFPRRSDSNVVRSERITDLDRAEQIDSLNIVGFACPKGARLRRAQGSQGQQRLWPYTKEG